MIALIHIIVLMCVCISASAQDTLHLVTGKKVSVHIIEARPDTVVFTLTPDSGASHIRIPTSRLHKITFSNGDSLKWENNFDIYDPAIDADSAFAKKLGLSKETYIRKKEAREAWESFLGGFVLFWFVPWP
jgi:hypothetical protein